MKAKFNTAVAAVFVVALGVNAKTVTVNEAKTVAGNYIASTTEFGTLKNQILNLNSTQTFVSALGQSKDAFFVFDVNQTQGFVIVSADDNISPILAYSSEGSFDATNMPEGLKKLLNRYVVEIKNAVDNNDVSFEANQEWTTLKNVTNKNGSVVSTQASVLPFITTKWSANAPYNTGIPAGGKLDAPELAWAQILRYYKFPERGYFYEMRGSQAGILAAIIGNTDYNYSLMPNVLTLNSSQAEKNEIGKLMYHVGLTCGKINGLYNSDNELGPNETMGTNFGYWADSIKYIDRQYYPVLSNWIAILKAELNAKRPIIYDVDKNNNVDYHTLLLDGYDANNRFHANWGWGGQYNGYYQLSVSVNGFVFDNGDYAQLNIIPNYTTKRSLVQTAAFTMPAVIANGSASSITVSIKNNGTAAYTADFYAAVFNNKNMFLGYIGKAFNKTIGANQTVSITLANPKINFLPGKGYKVLIGSSKTDQNGLYTTPMQYIKSNYSAPVFEVKVANTIVLASAIKVSPNPINALKSYAIEATFKNTGTTVFSGKIIGNITYAGLYSSYPIVVEVKNNIVIPAGGSVTLKFTRLKKSGEYIVLSPGVLTVSFATKKVNSTLTEIIASSALYSGSTPVASYSNELLDGWKRDLNLQELEGAMSSINEITLFPNPTVADMSINFDRFVEENVKIEVMNLQGQVIKVENFAGSNNFMLNTSDLAEGIYVLTISNGNKSRQERFVKIRQ